MLVRIANREDSDQTASSFMGRRTFVKSAYQKINFLISQPKHMLWEIKRTVSMRRFF